MAITRNRPKGRGQKKVINFLQDPVGVILIDRDRAEVVAFDPSRPLKSIVILRRQDPRFDLACEIGLRKRRPYRDAQAFYGTRVRSPLSRSEWEMVLPHIFRILRIWVEEGTAGWKTHSKFRVSWGKWVNRPRMQVRSNKYAQGLLRPRFLMFTVANSDGRLLRFFHRLSDLTLLRQRGREMSRTIEAAIERGKLARIPSLIVEFFPEKNLSRLSPSNSFFVSALLGTLLRYTASPQPAYREFVLRELIKSWGLNGARERIYRRLLGASAVSHTLARLEEQADSLLQGNAILERKAWPEFGYTVFRYSLSLLERST